MKSSWVRRVAAISMAFGVMTAAAGAMAQGTNDNTNCAGSSSTGANERNQTFCFVGESVSGSLVGAGGQPVRTMRRMSGVSLIRHRAHFVPEMLRSVEAF